MIGAEKSPSVLPSGAWRDRWAFHVLLLLSLASIVALRLTIANLGAVGQWVPTPVLRLAWTGVRTAVRGQGGLRTSSRLLRHSGNPSPTPFPRGAVSDDHAEATNASAQ